MGDWKYGLVELTTTQCSYCDSVPSNEGRASLVNSLIKAYHLSNFNNVEIINVIDAQETDLLKFHHKQYVDFLMKPRDHTEDDDIDDSMSDLQKFGLIYDCPIFSSMTQYVTTIAGSTLTSLTWLIRHSDSKSILMNWHGGRHHATRSMASGFCYINDIVLGITKLRTRFDKVMYIDFDLHHGNGVAAAFKMSSKVLTCSIHRHDLGFFPGTGELGDKGFGPGLNYDVNLPMKKGLKSETLLKLVNEVVVPILEKFEPGCLVVQCGCDGLSTDEHKEWNLTIQGLTECIMTVLRNSKSVPVLLLGGGGYNHPELAKFWTYLTSKVVGTDIEFDIIPEHDQLENYDSFQFWSLDRESNMKELNDKQWLDHIKDEINSRNII